MSDEPVIDPEAITTLRDLNPDDGGEFVREIIAIFIEDTGARISELKTTLVSGDTPTFTRAAHSIKGSSSNVGALRLRTIAERLEKESKTTPLPTLTPQLDDLESAFAEARAELDRLIS